MNKSNDIGELAAALSKLQGEVEDAAKNSKGYGSIKYADLSSILDIVRPLLCKNSLAVTQLCKSDLVDGVSFAGIETMLMHSSGQFISSTSMMKVEPSKMKFAQEVGSVTTYTRRYALAAILGITQTDDLDGNKNEINRANKNNNGYNKKPNGFQQKPEPDCSLLNTSRERLRSLILGKRVTADEVESWVKKANEIDGGVHTFMDLSLKRLSPLIVMLEKRKEDTNDGNM